MKKTVLALLVSVCALSSAFAQSITIIPETRKKNIFTVNDQLPYQQLIGYAIEVSSSAYIDEVGLGLYPCEKIYSMEGYDILPQYSCELFVHSKEGPIVVRYQGVSEELDEEIKQFISENQFGSSLYYNQGRFRFEVEKSPFIEEE